jgi:flagellar biosynthesis GTPase FlhF
MEIEGSMLGIGRKVHYRARNVTRAVISKDLQAVQVTLTLVTSAIQTLGHDPASRPSTRSPRPLSNTGGSGVCPCGCGGRRRQNESFRSSFPRFAEPANSNSRQRTHEKFEHQRQADESRRQREADEDAQQRDEERLKQEREEKRKREEAEAHAHRQQEEEEKRKAEAERRAREEEERRWREEEEAKRRAEAEQRRKEEEERRRREDEDRRKRQEQQSASNGGRGDAQSDTGDHDGEAGGRSAGASSRSTFIRNYWNKFTEG